MRLSWWESIALCGLLALGALFLTGQLWVPGIVLVALAAFAAASRSRIAERNVAGYRARVYGLLLLLRASALFVIYMVLVVLFFVMRRDHWTHEERGAVAFYACAALALYLVRDIWTYGNRAADWIAGADAEERVAAALDPLRAQGWLVVHNVDRDGRGNVDHFLSGPSGAFAIETKSGRYSAIARGQAISNAIWAKEKFGQRWVTAVLCVATDPPPMPELLRHGNATVWLLGPDQLRDWVLAQPSPASAAS